MKGRKADSGKNVIVKGAVVGGIAGALDVLITYPSDFIKTQMLIDKQKNQKYLSSIDCLKKTVKQHGILGLYRGVSFLLLCNIPKLALRFGIFEYVNYKLQDEHGDLSLKHTFFAGMIAGMAEAVFIVSPIETVKLNVINEMAKPKPQFRGIYSGVRNITKMHGIRGLYTGLSMTALKEGTNQAVRFYLMCTQKDFYTGHDNAVLIPMPMIGIFGLIAGAASVLTNVTGDLINMRMKSKKDNCRNPFDCYKKILQTEGPRGLLQGNTSLMARVCIDVAITFMIYESIVDYVFDNMWL